MDLGTQTFLGPRELVPFLTQTLGLKKLKYLIYHNKILQGSLFDRNVYMYTLYHTKCHVCEHDEHVYAMEAVHAYMEFVSFEA